MLSAACSSDSPPPTVDQSQTSKDLTGFDQVGPTPDGPKPPAPDGPAPQGDGPKPTADGPKPTADGKKPALDFPSKYDGATGITCAQIGDCSDKCAFACPGGLQKLTCMINCSNTCRAKGCASAQAAFGTLYTCINGNCALNCINGPDAGCKTCVQTKCTTQLKACDAQSC